MRIGIHGFGRIGRAIYRLARTSQTHEVAMVNDIRANPRTLAYLINHDSVYGTLTDPIKPGPATITDRGRQVAVRSEPKLNEVGWDELAVDVVVDASDDQSGVGRARDLLRASRSVKAVIITRSIDDVDYTLVLGANDHGFDADRHRLISSSICDAVAIAPVLSEIHAEIPIEWIGITTIHPALGYQNLLDGFPADGRATELGLGRSSIANVIPKSTSVGPALRGVLRGWDEVAISCVSFRVPTAAVTAADISLRFRRSASKEELKDVLLRIRRSQQVPLLTLSTEPIVSSDIIGSQYSAVADMRWLDVEDRMGKLMLWYDNEWGYAARVLDQVRLFDPSPD